MSHEFEMAIGRLRDTVSIITGGGGGIGSAAGLIFCREGGKVMLVDSENDALQAAAERIRREVPAAQISTVRVDLGEEIAAQIAVDETLSQYGSVDILVNNVGIRRYEAMADMSWDQWDPIIRINLLSYTSMTRAALPSLRASGRGSIINTASINAFHSRGGTGAYDAMKAAVLAFTRTVAVEERQHNIRANSVCPGYTLTSFHEKRLGKERLDSFLPSCIMQRWAAPEEVAYPMLWLASTEGSYITAAELKIDGGYPMFPDEQQHVKLVEAD
ncbi:hypothetical protein LTR37_010695 [Vermiconidia calcicola]|uniref:Uncharacterized protein n=1 Tax=Vermiconidia calcicola TaxID=1690605 RepID=A0ACC3N476_9PEZI|nr:hypothetical protein LTR37_010695 [Vermiconidia calcicola]